MEQRKINVGFVSTEDPHDRRLQSGTTFQVFRALDRQKEVNVFWIPFKDNLLSKIYLYIQKVIQKVLRIPMPKTRCVSYTRLKQLSLDKKLMSDADVIYCPFTQLVSCGKPMVYMADAVFHQMINYYWSDNMSPLVIRSGERLQQKALDCATKLALPSKWMIDSAVKDYHQPYSKISLIEYGANIDERDLLPRTFRYDGHLHLLFIGVDWVRKGGSIAIDACRWLNENGIPATIHILGGKGIEPHNLALSYVDYIGFLDKNDSKQYNRLISLISFCHCMLLPTKAECAGIAFCESSAYGLPSFSYATGGVPNYVLDGRNGYLLPLGSTGADFGQKIKDCLENGELERMSSLAIEVYNECLNWDTWGTKTAAVLMSAIK